MTHNVSFLHLFALMKEFFLQINCQLKQAEKSGKGNYRKVPKNTRKIINFSRHEKCKNLPKKLSRQIDMQYVLTQNNIVLMANLQLIN